MARFIIKKLVLVLPASFLPEGTKMTSNGRFNLNKEERRELLERQVLHRINKFLDKYSPFRKWNKFVSKRKVQKSKQALYQVIGEMALTHAGIEKGLQNSLVVDWGCKEDIVLPSKKKQKHNRNVKLTKLHGNQLLGDFPEILRCIKAPEEFIKTYEDYFKKLKQLNQKRNEALKAVYSFNVNNGRISRIIEKNHMRDFDSKNWSYEEHLQNWMPSIEIDELKRLCEDLKSVSAELFKLRCEIKIHKHKIIGDFTVKGKSYPDYAFKNPYLYLSMEGDCVSTSK